MARIAQHRGIAYPFRKGSTSFPEKSTDEQLIKEDLYQLIRTGTNSRVMRPTFGTDIYKFLFEANSDLLGAAIQAELQSVVVRFEPRVVLNNVQIFRVESQVILKIDYTVLATGNTNSVDIRFSTP